MTIQEYVSLAPHTTFHIGGSARFFIEVSSEEELREVISFAHAQHLPVYPLGAGSNVLVPDDGIRGVVVRIAIRGISIEEQRDDTLLIAGAGVAWEDVVRIATDHDLFGIENLAGIPGTVGGAVVQNIGAYGVELSTTFAYAECIDVRDMTIRRVMGTEARFAYRMSLFKENRHLIVTRVGLRLVKQGTPVCTYPDLTRLCIEGVALSTPSEIAEAVRMIRKGKFPHSADEGTAGSFFKNPSISKEQSEVLKKQFPEMPMFPQASGGVKVPLAWILDHVLSLKGYARDGVRLYEKQPLIIVARAGASAEAVDALAHEVAERVYERIGIHIEREVETFGEARA